MQKEDKIKGVLLLMERCSNKEIAKYIVNLNETIEGQCENMNLWVKKFRDLFYQIHTEKDIFNAIEKELYHRDKDHFEYNLEATFRKLEELRKKITHKEDCK